jgi:hypothetical protein
MTRFLFNFFYIGLGLVIVISVFFTVFALRHPLATLREKMGANLTTPLLHEDTKTEDLHLPSLYSAPTGVVKETSFDRKSFM